MSRWYSRNGGDPILLTGDLVSDIMPVVNAEYERDEHRVAEDFVEGYRVSTVFLGFDHGWMHFSSSLSSSPVLWETMVFAEDEAEDGLGWEGYRDRYTSEVDAKEGHERVVALIKNGERPT